MHPASLIPTPAEHLRPEHAQLTALWISCPAEPCALFLLPGYRKMCRTCRCFDKAMVEASATFYVSNFTVHWAQLLSRMQCL